MLNVHRNNKKIKAQEGNSWRLATTIKPITTGDRANDWWFMNVVYYEYALLGMVLQTLEGIPEWKWKIKDSNERTRKTMRESWKQHEIVEESTSEYVELSFTIYPSSIRLNWVLENWMIWFIILRMFVGKTMRGLNGKEIVHNIPER